MWELQLSNQISTTYNNLMTALRNNKEILFFFLTLSFFLFSIGLTATTSVQATTEEETPVEQEASVDNATEEDLIVVEEVKVQGTTEEDTNDNGVEEVLEEEQESSESEMTKEVEDDLEEAGNSDDDQLLIEASSFSSFSVVSDSKSKQQSVYCPLENMPGRIIVDFSDVDDINDIKIRSNQGESGAKISLGTSIPSGEYKVTLVGSDTHPGRENVSQPNEQYFLELFNGAQLVATSGVLDDVPDMVLSATSTTVVDTNLVVSMDVDSVTAVHAAYPFISNTNSNSVNVICGAFDLIEKEEPEPDMAFCPLEAKEGRIIVDFSGISDVKIRSNQDEAGATLTLGASIPSGTYKVTLVGSDTYDGREKITQSKEQYFLELFDGGDLVAATGVLDDLQDKVHAATSTTVVNTDLVVSKDIDTVAAVHAAYPDTSTSHSINVNCAAFDLVEKEPEPEPEPEFGYCPLETKPGRIIVEFPNLDVKLCQGSCGVAEKEVAANIPAGTYDITLVGSDSYPKRASANQPFEQYIVVLKDGSTILGTTNPLDDLQDGVVSATSTTLVNTDFVISSGVDTVVARHAYAPDQSKMHSLVPNCVAFDLVEIEQCVAPILTSSTNIEVEVGEFVSYTLTATSTSAVSFGLATSTLPNGLVFDDVNNTISGTTTTAGVFTVDLTITNTCEVVDDSITITITEPVDDSNGGGGGGGGRSSSGGGSARDRDGEVLGDTIGICAPLLTDYLRMGQNNDADQVRLLQAFLKGVEGFDVDVNGIFDQKTDTAVRAFQVRYAEDILLPWGLSANEPTGYVYYTTQKKINEIYCERPFHLTSEQNNQIEECRIKLQNKQAGIGGGEVAGSDFGPKVGSRAEYDRMRAEYQGTAGQIGQATSTSVTLTLTDTTEDGTGIAAGASEGGDDSFFDMAGQRIKDVAAAAFTLPGTPRDTVFYALWLVLILALVYILGSLGAGVRDIGTFNQAQIRIRKLIYFMVGTLIGLVVAVALNLVSLIVPLIVVIIVLSIALLYYTRKTSA